MSRHQKKSHTPPKKRVKKRRARAESGGDLQGVHGTMTDMVRGFRRVTGAGSAESRSMVGTALLLTLAAGLAILLAIGLSN